MKVLIACEESQTVCKEMRQLGHEAYSCDIQECSGGYPEWHIQGDVLPLLNGRCSFLTIDGVQHIIDSKWDLIIAHPPCTHLAASGARHFEKKREDGRQLEAIKFFNAFLNADCDRIAIENPVGIIGGRYMKKWFPEYSNMPSCTQIIQPFEYGHPVSKKTCLWLKNLPKLCPTNIVEPDWNTSSSGKRFSGAAWCAKDENGKILSWSDPRTAKERSKTFIGIAKAMAEQWTENVYEGQK